MIRGHLPILLLLVACAPDRESRVEYPPLGGASAALISLETPGAISIWAVDLGTSAPLLVPAPDAESDATLEVALLDRPLVELGLAPGALTRDTSSVASALPGARTRYRLTFDDDLEPGPWVEAGAPSSLFAAFRVRLGPRPAGPCPRWVEEPLTITEFESGIAGACALDDESVLVSAYEGELVRVFATHLEVLPRAPFGIYGCRRGAAGTLWVGGPRGSIFEATLTATGGLALIQRGSAGTVQPTVAIASEGEGDALTVYAATGEGVLLRWTPQGGLQIDHRLDTLQETTVFGLAVSGGVAYLSSEMSPVIVTDRAGEIGELAPPLDGVSIPSLAWTPSGLVAGSSGGSLARLEAGAWVIYPPLPDEPIKEIQSIAVAPDGLLLGTSLAKMVLLLDGADRFCPAVSFSGYSLRHLALIGPMVVGTGNRPGDHPLAVSRFTRRQ